MKKVLLILSVFVLCGCYDKEPQRKNGMNSLFIETVGGHDYIIFDGYNKGGIVHAESCPCKQNKKRVRYE